MNVVIMPSTREPQCPYLINDGVRDKYGRPRCVWHCQGELLHDGDHQLPPNNSGAIITHGDWFLSNLVMPHEV